MSGYFDSSDAIKKILESFSKQIRDNGAFLKGSPRYLEVSIAFCADRPGKSSLSTLEEGFDIYRSSSCMTAAYLPKKAGRESTSLTQRVLRKLLLKHYNICEYLHLIGSRYPKLSVLELFNIEQGVRVKKVYLNGQVSIEIAGAKDVLSKLGFIEVDN